MPTEILNREATRKATLFLDCMIAISMMARVISVLLLLTACGNAKPSASSVEPDDNSNAAFIGVENRALNFLDSGFIISRRGGHGTPVNQGDGLLFTGLGAYAMDCDHGAPLSLAMGQMVSGLAGGLFRHPTLPGQVSLDGALGFYRAVTKRVLDCGERGQWTPLMAQHLAYMAGHGGLLNAHDTATLPVGFDFVARKLGHELGLNTEPGNQGELEDAVVAWAAATMETHAACYRLNLGLTAFQTVERLGVKINPLKKDAFCAVTRGSRIPVLDQWCGRGGLLDYLDTFQWDQWQYRHQRCSSWETPDGNGDSEPAIDFLVGWADYNP